jgi:hypothetical protein
LSLLEDEISDSKGKIKEEYDIGEFWRNLDSVASNTKQLISHAVQVHCIPAPMNLRHLSLTATAAALCPGRVMIISRSYEFSQRSGSLPYSFGPCFAVVISSEARYDLKSFQTESNAVTNKNSESVSDLRKNLLNNSGINQSVNNETPTPSDLVEEGYVYCLVILPSVFKTLDGKF